MKKADLINAIDETYKDEEVKKNPDIREFLLKFAQQLSEGRDVGLISVKLSNAITDYSLKMILLFQKH